MYCHAVVVSTYANEPKVHELFIYHPTRSVNKIILPLNRNQQSTLSLSLFPKTVLSPASIYTEGALLYYNILINDYMWYQINN